AGEGTGCAPRSPDERMERTRGRAEKAAKEQQGIGLPGALAESVGETGGDLIRHATDSRPARTPSDRTTPRRHGLRTLVRPPRDAPSSSSLVRRGIESRRSIRSNRGPESFWR